MALLLVYTRYASASSSTIVKFDVLTVICEWFIYEVEYLELAMLVELLGLFLK